jgi:hypothetical protein
MKLVLLGLFLSYWKVVVHCVRFNEGTTTSLDDNTGTPSCAQPLPLHAGTTARVTTPEERKAILQKIIDDYESSRQGKPPRREEKLFQMLEDWKDLYVQEGDEAIQDFYTMARDEIFIWKEDGSANDNAPDNLDEDTKEYLLRWLQKWDYLKENYGKEALYYWYRATMYEVFGMPDLFFTGEEDTVADPNDPWYVTDNIDSLHGTLRDIDLYLECYEYQDRPVEYFNEQDIWRYIQQIYLAAVGPGKSTIPELYGTGFQVKVKFDYAKGKGRGVFAAEDIPKDTIILKEIYAGFFDNAPAYRKFLLTLPPNLACDYRQWQYIYADDNFDFTTLRIGVDLDGAGLLNWGEDDEVNMAYLRKGTGVSIATRDIKAGEEILVDYDEFLARIYKWNYFGLKYFWEDDGFDAESL